MGDEKNKSLERYRKVTQADVFDLLLKNARRLRQAHQDELREGGFVYDQRGESIVPRGSQDDAH